MIAHFSCAAGSISPSHLHTQPALCRRKPINMGQGMINGMLRVGGEAVDCPHPASRMGCGTLRFALPYVPTSEFLYFMLGSFCFPLEIERTWELQETFV